MAKQKSDAIKSSTPSPVTKSSYIPIKKKERKADSDDEKDDHKFIRVINTRPKHIINTTPDPVINNTCYIVIKCHGVIDASTIVPVPEGKSIYKLNKAACGYSCTGTVCNESTKSDLSKYASYMEYNDLNYVDPLPRYMSEMDPTQIDRFNRQYPSYLNDINPVATFESYERDILEFNEKNEKDFTEGRIPSFKRIPNMSCDVNAKVCRVMNKNHYYKKNYWIYSSEEKRFKWDYEQYGGIFIYIKSEYGVGWDIYNLFVPSDLTLFCNYYHISQTIFKNKRIIKDRPTELYGTINTEDLFYLFSKLPFSIFKILDMSCSNFMNPPEVPFSYTGDIGYGKYQKRNTINKTRLRHSTKNRTYKNKPNKYHRCKYNNCLHKQMKGG